MDDKVVVQPRLVAQPLLPHRQKLVEGHGQVVVLDEDLSLEVDPWQGALLWRVQGISSDPPAGIGRMFAKKLSHTSPPRRFKRLSSGRQCRGRDPFVSARC